MKLAKMIDHTLLKANASCGEVRQICEEAKQYGFASVCVNPYHTAFVSERLQGSDVKTCTVVGFPLGASTTASKVFEAREAMRNGAREIDMVANIGAFLDGDDDCVVQDIREIVTAVHGRAWVKVILETCLLTDEQKIKLCELCVKAKADFVKTSTGFSTGGATVHDVALMKQAVGGRALVKASGGIRTREDALKMIEAGADRLGTSQGVALVSENSASENS
jgi:deoxyribose-phosphate aldolase